jgi:hypothetical protein
MNATVRQPRAPLSVTCPKTGELIETGIPTDADTLAKNWGGDVSVKCPSCGATHSFPLKDTFLRQAIAAYQMAEPEAERV